MENELQAMRTLTVTNSSTSPSVQETKSLLFPIAALVCSIFCSEQTNRKYAVLFLLTLAHACPVYVNPRVLCVLGWVNMD